MLQVRRILQLKVQGDSNRKIARALQVSRDTVSFYVHVFENSGKSYEQLLLFTEEALSLLVYNDPPVVQSDWRYTDIQERISSICDELQKPKTTRMILWEEYRVLVPDGYGYSQFCEHISRFLESRKAVMHFEHEPAAMMMFDFAGDKLPLADKETGEITLCSVLICVLPFSGFTYIEALITARREQLLKGLNNSLSYFGGVPLSVKTDNLGQFVKKSNRYEPIFDELANQWSLHYNTTLMASRVRKPRDKASVESGVNSIYNRVYAAIRNMIFHSIGQMNMALWEQMEKFNCRNFQRCDYSRRDRYLQYEKKLLRALPGTSFVPKHMVTAKVQRNYHIILGEDSHYYSVPFQHIGKKVQIIYDTDNVEIYLNQCRLVAHKRNYHKGGYTTVADHLPPAHRHYSRIRGWNKEYFIEQAMKVGESTTAVITKILEQKIFIEQTYNSCLGVLRLKEKYGNDRLEAACKRAIGGYKLNYNIIKNILERNLDKAPEKPDLLFNIPEHENIRGPESFN